MSARRRIRSSRAGRCSAAGLLRVFNEVGLLSAADVHVATRVAALAGEEDEAVKLAVALAVRGPRLGHVFVDLATIRDSATVESDEPVDLSALPWPASRRLAHRGAQQPAGRARARTTLDRRTRRCGCSARGSTSIATGARSARSRPT